MITSEQKISDSKCRRHFEYIIPILSIALFLATLPLQTNYNIWAMAIMAVAILISFFLHQPRSFQWQPIYFVLVALYLIHVVGLLYTGDLNLGVRRLDSIVPLLAFPVLFSIIRLSKENVTLLLRFFVWSVIAFCGFGFLSYATIIPGWDWNMAYRDSKLYAPLLLMWPAQWNPSVVSVALLMAVPVSISSLFSNISSQGIGTPRGWGRLFESCLGVLFPIIFTVLAGARVGIVIIPCLLGLAYVFYCKFKPLLKWGLVVAGALAAVFIFYTFPQVDDRFHDPIREDLRTLATDAIKEKPVFGWGTGYVEPLIRSEATVERLNISTPYPFNQFHNVYLEMAVQFGIPGILLLSLLLGWIGWMGIRKKDFLLLSLLVIYLFNFWTESGLFFSSVTPFAFWLCFLVATQKERQIRLL